MKKIPRHIAIIMDGNGRWAKSNGMTRIEGHVRGASRIEDVIDACKERGIKYVTLYAFSEENWNRPNDEIEALLTLLGQYLATKRDSMVEKGVHFRTIGDIGRLKSDLIRDVRKTENATRMCNDITMIVALSYGSRGEICRAVNSLIKGGIDRITPDDISSALDTSEIPDPDLLIRTSGEHRISNFLLWQMAYTELYFTDIHWPDFDEVELDKALKSYAKRERRFGMTAEQLPD